MKTVIFFTALVMSHFIFAADFSLVECTSEGVNVPLTISMRTQNERMPEAKKLNLVAQGMMRTPFEFKVTESSQADGILSMELLTEGLEVVKATLNLKIFSSFVSGRSFPVDGEIIIHQKPASNRFILNHYELDACKGII